MNFFKKIFPKNKDENQSQISEFELDETEKPLFYDFINLGENDKIKRIMAYGNAGDLKYYKIFKYSIIYETSIHVKCAALKRLHLFKAHNDCIPMITGLKNIVNVRPLEPYYSWH
jgi:hypothetical protein